MSHSLAFYLQRRDEALEHAADNPLSGDDWLRLAAEWQKIHDALASLADKSTDQGSPPA
jgi:hypothetical protein